MLLNDTLQLLSNPQRRDIMYVMDKSNDDVFEYDDIAEGMIEQNYMREEEKERFEAQMTHAHLPKMEESGLIEHDKRSETVCYIQDKDVGELLEFIEEYEI